MSRRIGQGEQLSSVGGLVAAWDAVRIRPLRPGEVEPVEAVFAGMSARSRYQRFHAPVPRLPLGWQRILSAVDGERRVALVAEAAEREGWRVVGIARFARTAVDEVELAVAVVDTWQRRGVGLQLLTALSDEIVALGYRRVTASLLAENSGVLALLRRVFPDATVSFDDGTIAFSARLPAAAAAIQAA